MGEEGGEVVLLCAAPGWGVAHQAHQAHQAALTAGVSRAVRGTDRVTDKTRQTSLLLLVMIILCYCCFWFSLIDVALLAVKDIWIVVFFFFVYL